MARGVRKLHIPRNRLRRLLDHSAARRFSRKTRCAGLFREWGREFAGSISLTMPHGQSHALLLLYLRSPLALSTALSGDGVRRNFRHPAA